MPDKLSVDFDALAFVSTAHVTGLKKTFFSGDDAASSLTQFAYGKLLAGEAIPPHAHPTMEEFFYFLEGKGKYTVQDEEIALKPGVAVRIPAGTQHALTADQTLEFVYFGIAI